MPELPSQATDWANTAFVMNVSNSHHGALHAHPKKCKLIPEKSAIQPALHRDLCVCHASLFHEGALLMRADG
jgi:hypothetical protein